MFAEEFNREQRDRLFPLLSKEIVESSVAERGKDRLKSHINANLCSELLNEKLARSDFWSNVPEFISSDSVDLISHQYIHAFYCDEAIFLINPANAVILPRLASALDMVAACHCHPGGVILVPAPYDVHMQNFWWVNSSATIVGVPFENIKKPRLDCKSFQRVLDQIRLIGGRVDAIYLQNPHDPLGVYFGASEFSAVCEWALRNDLLVVVDESLAHTVDWPSGDGDDCFTSLLKLLSHPTSASGAAAGAGSEWTWSTVERLMDKLVYVWNSEQDFAIPGIQLTTVFTTNQRLKEKLRYWEAHQPSARLTLHFVEKLLDDFDWVSHFQITKYNQLLKSRKTTISWLQDASSNRLPPAAGGVAIAASRPTAGTSILISLRPFLPSDDFEGEEALRCELAAKTGLVMNSGSQLGYTREPGWFRFIVSRRRRALDEALRSLAAALGTNVSGQAVEQTNSALKRHNDLIGSFDEDSSSAEKQDEGVDRERKKSQIGDDDEAKRRKQTHRQPRVVHVLENHSDSDDHSVAEEKARIYKNDWSDNGDNGQWNIDQFDTIKYGGGAVNLWSSSTTETPPKTAPQTADYLQPEKTAEKSSVHWIDENTIPIGGGGVLAPAGVPLTIDIPIRVEQKRLRNSDDLRSTRQNAEISKLIDQIFENAIRETSSFAAAARREPQIWSRSDSGLAESGTPEILAFSPLSSETVEIISPANPRRFSRDLAKRPAAQSVSTDYATTFPSLHSSKITRFESTVPHYGPPAQKYLKEPDVFVEMQPGTLNVDFPLRIAAYSPIQPLQKGAQVQIDNFFTEKQKKSRELTSSKVIVDSYNSRVSASHIYIEPSFAPEIDQMFRDILVEKNIFAFTDVVISEPRILSYRCDLFASDFNFIDGVRQKRISFDSGASLGPQQVHHEIQILRPHEHAAQKFAVEHMKITEIEYSNGVKEHTETGELVSATTTTCLGKNRFSPSKYLTKVYMNGGRNGDDINSVDIAKKYVEQRITRSYNDSSQNASLDDIITTPRNRIDTTYFVIRSFEQDFADIQPSLQPQQTNLVSNLDGCVKVGENFVERSVQTDEAEDIVTRLRFRATKMPAESTSDRGEPVNYEYLVCRNKKHIKQGQHCNPDRCYALQQRRKRNDHEEASNQNSLKLRKNVRKKVLKINQDDNVLGEDEEEGAVSVTTTTAADRSIAFERVEVRGAAGPWIVSSVHKTTTTKKGNK